MSRPVPDGDGLAGERALARLGSADLNLLVPLLALLEERSVTRAAERVGLSQPAMSHALRRLRSLLGDQLLVRQGGSMALTPHAEQLMSPSRRALEAASRILDPSPFDPATTRRTITVTLTTTTAFVVGPRLMQLVAERAPHAVLRMRTTNDMGSPTVFTDDGVDVVLLPKAFGTAYPREELYDDRWVVLVSPLVPSVPDTVEILRSEPHMIFDDLPQGRARPYDVLERAGVSPTVRYVVSDFLLIPHLLASTRAVALHRFQVGAEFQGFTAVRMLDFPFPLPPIGIDMVWNPWLTDDGFRRWLRRLLWDAADPLRERSWL